MFLRHSVEVVQTCDVDLPVDDTQQRRFRVSRRHVLQQLAVDVDVVDFVAQINRRRHHVRY